MENLVFIREATVRANGLTGREMTLPPDRGFQPGDVIKIYGMPGSEDLVLRRIPKEDIETEGKRS